MIEIEAVIIIVIAIVVWLFIHFRKKRHESEAGSSVKSVSTQNISPEPEPEPKDELKIEPTPIRDEPASVETNEVTEVVDVIPEDSTLRRHYLQNLGALSDTSGAAETNVNEELDADSVSEDSEIKVDVVGANSGSSIPEDSVLKRHFIQQLVAQTEATMPARPTDSTLKRHYDAQLLNSVISQLQALK